MANGEDIRRTSHTPNDQRVQNSLHFKGRKDQTSPTFQQLLQRDGSKWSRISSQIKKKEDNENRQTKKSVLAKVKEHAKKLKISLRRKKHSLTNESRCHATRSSYVGPKDKGEEDVEYHSARMHDSKHKPGTNKEDLVSSFEKNLETLNTRQSKEEHARYTNATEALSNSSVTVPATDTKNQPSITTDAPTIHEFPQRNPRFSTLMVSTLETSKNKSDRSFKDEVTMKGESQARDKGVVTVKDYLMHKFQPGEDERALSKVITQTLSPRRDKMRETMSLFLKNEESSELSSSNVDNNVDFNIKSKSLPTSTNLDTNNASKITPIKQSYSLGTNASKASLNLNQTFKSTFASYQDRFLFLGSSSNNSMTLKGSATSSSTNITQGSDQSLSHLNSPTKTNSSPVGITPTANCGNQAFSRGLASSAKKTLVPGRTATSVRRVHVSRAIQKQVPIHTETNTINSVSCI